MIYLYDYWIFEDVDGKENLIALYQSNAVPPAVGTILDLSDYVTTPHGNVFRGQVTGIVAAPAFADEYHLQTSDQVVVSVFLISKSRRKENGEIINANVIPPR